MDLWQRLSTPPVYAGGDVAERGGPPLTPVASYEGILVAANLLKGNSQKPNYLGIPTVVFAIPPLAAVGLSESEAHKQASGRLPPHSRRNPQLKIRCVISARP